MRDSKGTFKSEELLFPLLRTAKVINIIFLIFNLLPWFYVGLKFIIYEPINVLLNSLFFYYSKCECNNYANGENKYKIRQN